MHVLVFVTYSYNYPAKIKKTNRVTLSMLLSNNSWKSYWYLFGFFNVTSSPLVRRYSQDACTVTIKNVKYNQNQLNGGKNIGTCSFGR